LAHKTKLADKHMDKENTEPITNNIHPQPRLRLRHKSSERYVTSRNGQGA